MPSHATAKPLVEPTHLPDDPALLKAMLVELLQALRDSQRDVEQLQARLDQLLRRLYGPRAERFDPKQLLLFAEPTPEPAAEAAATPAALEAVTGQASGRPRHGHGRRRLPAHLPRRRRVHELTEAERLCPCCGTLRAVVGEEISEQLEYVPASLLVIEHVRLRYACHDCEQQRAVDAAASNAAAPGATTAASPPVLPAPPLTTASTFATAAKPAQPIAAGLPGPGLLAHVIVSKYGDHLPLYRLEQIFGRQGLQLARQTLCGWLPVCAALLRPLYDLMRARLWQSWVVGSDDTPVAVQEPGRGQTRTGRVWVYVGDVFAPYLIYDYTPTREQQGPQQFLKDYLGYFQADAYGGYDALYASRRLAEVGCWAHARRKFHEAQATDPERAVYVLGVIRRLYAVEQQADEEIAQRGLSREQGWWLRLRLRQEQSAPLLTRLCQWLQQERAKVLPKSPIGEAIGYALNQWAALERYTMQGYLAIDNNAAERALRAIAVGRKNYLFFGSDVGGETAAVLYSFVQTCKRLQIEPWRYLRDVLERLPSWPAERLEELLPDQWAAAERAALEAETGQSPPGVDSG